MIKQLFDDRLFEMCAERALATISRGGAEYGECAATARRIAPGDVDSWFREWVTSAEQVQTWADESARRHHRESAREAYLRASTYYRTSYCPLFGAPVDPRVIDGFDRASECFDKYAALTDPALRSVEISFEATSLPGYLCVVDDAAVARPTVIGVNGYDGTLHDMYGAHAIPALRRGYNCLLVDGPGQGRVLIKQGIHMRPDWETVLRAVLDFACARPEIDRNRIAVMGWSFGGFLAPRAVGGDERVAALIVDPGQWDLLESMRAALPLPPAVKERLPHVESAEIDRYLAGTCADPLVRWRLVQRGLWVHGLNTLGEYVLSLADYRVSDIADRIACPTLVACAEGDPIAASAKRLYDALQCPKTFVQFTEREGADAHCEAWNRSRFDQKAFDWLDETFARPH